LLRGFVDKQAEKRGMNVAQKARIENAGVLTASGLIAGEALMGLAAAGVVAYQAWKATPGSEIGFPQVPGFAGVSGWLAIAVMVFLLVYMVRRPLGKAGAPDEPAPPTAVM
jgi:hypothetical protein